MSGEMRTMPCRACGCPVLFAVNPETGRRIPLDARATTYTVHVVDGVPTIKAKTTGADRAYVSHFCTCPDGQQFSKSKPNQGGA